MASGFSKFSGLAATAFTAVGAAAVPFGAVYLRSISASNPMTTARAAWSPSRSIKSPPNPRVSGGCLVRGTKASDAVPAPATS
jgi:hypothetical protein